MAVSNDVALAVGQQVEQMIMQAKSDSELRVRHELSGTKTRLAQMKGMIEEISERVIRVSRAGGAGGQDGTVDQRFLTDVVGQLEQKWSTEVKALKQDLHRTILAHNHNSDLMRRHRDALEDTKRKMDLMTLPRAEHQDIDKVERALRGGQTKQRAVDALAERLVDLEQQHMQMLIAAGMHGPGGLVPPPGMVGGAAGGPAAAAAAAATAAAATKKKNGKEETPSEEEVRARFMQASRLAPGGAADAATSFNAEAPVFIPRGAAAEAEEEAAQDDSSPILLAPPGIDMEALAAGAAGAAAATGAKALDGIAADAEDGGDAAHGEAEAEASPRNGEDAGKDDAQKAQEL